MFYSIPMTKLRAAW